MNDKLEQIKKILASHFGLTDECPDGTYLYQLTRVKPAFHVGTMTLDDFVEVDEEFLDEVFEGIKPVVEDLQKQIEQQQRQLQKVRENISETLEVLKRGGPGIRSQVQRLLEETLEGLEEKEVAELNDADNAVFIAHAREDVPKLVAEVERLRDAIIEAIDDIETISPHEAKKTLSGALNNSENGH